MIVTLLTQANCGLCQTARQVLDRLAVEHRYTIELLDFGSAEGQALAERGGIWFPPGVLIDGEPFSYGRISERKLRVELERRAAAPQHQLSFRPPR